jgi:hypothetical protein
MTKKIKIPKSVRGYGYSGVWICPENTIGWGTTPFISGKSDRSYPSGPPNHLRGRFFLCEISIKPLLDKKGRPITKIIK